MPAIQAVGVGLSVLGAYQQSQSTKQAYEYQSRVQANNAKIAEWQAQDAIERGQKEEAAHRQKLAALKGTQRASMAARGLDLGFGSPLDILTSTEYVGEIEALNIRDNAARTAWAYRNQSRDATSDAGMLKSRADAESPWMAAGSTLLTRGASVAEKWLPK